MCVQEQEQIEKEQANPGANQPLDVQAYFLQHDGYKLPRMLRGNLHSGIMIGQEITS